VLRFVGRRLLITIPTLLGVVLITVLLVDLMPGDPAEVLAGENASPEAVTTIREQLHLDQPIWTRFADYVGGAVHGDLGRSPVSNIPVWSRIATALPATLSLALVAMVMSLLVALPAGTWAGLRRDRFVDRAVTTLAAVFQAIPAFVVGLVLVIVFAVDRTLLPANGYVPFTEDPWSWFTHLILPASALALSSTAELARQTRGAVVDTLEHDYIRVARAKGLRERLVVGKHVAKNASTPVMTVAGLQIGRIIGGAVVIELIFGIQGFGSLAVSAVSTRDLPLIQGVVLVSAVLVLLANLAVDVSYGYLNPKVRVR
jgi:peptide/nickel transport system permease protein